MFVGAAGARILNFLLHLRKDEHHLSKRVSTRCVAGLPSLAAWVSITPTRSNFNASRMGRRRFSNLRYVGSIPIRGAKHRTSAGMFNGSACKAEVCELDSHLVLQIQFSGRLMV